MTLPCPTQRGNHLEFPQQPQHETNQWKANVQTGRIVSTRDGARLKEDKNFPHTLLSYIMWKLAVTRLAIGGD